MKGNIILEKSFAFAIEIVLLYKMLNKEKKEFILSKQILKSGTSIGANMHEADAAISKADFSAKTSIAYKEAKETQFWLRLLYKTGYIDRKTFMRLFEHCDEICKILFSILKSSGRMNRD